MTGLHATEIKAFVPARNFARSLQFYTDLGFEVAWQSGDLACLHVGASSFLLQQFYVREHAENFMMHLLVPDVEAWWRRGGFDHVEKYDERIALFATRLSEGRHEFSYLVRATTAGTFRAAGTWAEEMYAPEVNGRTAPAVIVVK